jgi:hypothetical protein
MSTAGLPKPVKLPTRGKRVPEPAGAAATAGSVQEPATIKTVRTEALRLWRNDKAAANRFLSRPNPALGGRDPLAVARTSSAGAQKVIQLILAARASTPV